MIRSFVHTQDVSLGLDPDRVMTFRMSAQWSERFDAAVQRQARTVARTERHSRRRGRGLQSAGPGCD
jgi:hypothetical protein